ncbi:hypothetical protein AnigIFM50267_000481 [Aspergillus niger]|nr:hypothetical protein AnigIFM50267_000481 [Aspergillus niger]
MSRLLSVMVIHNKDICQTAHGTAHTERTEDERPHDFVEKIAGAGHDEDADSEEDDFCDEGIQIEEEKWADVAGTAFLGYWEVFFRCYNGLVGVWEGHLG